MQRTNIIDCQDHLEKDVTIYGWVNTYRKMSKVAFIDLRDRSGIMQVVLEQGNLDENSFKLLDEIKPEYVIAITGKVMQRGEKFVNDKIPTGHIEMQAKSVEILSTSETPPFEIDHETPVGEEVRMKYRYLDLRRERMKNNIISRYQITHFIRQFLNKENFIEIETPIISKSTPEGARDYLVPSRLQPGSFYALPQSPQQYKQLLMSAGFEKYFQLARCFRDEDTRGDRQPEFTQLDLEMSFVTQEEVMRLTEDMLIKLIETLYPDKRIQETPFPVYSYHNVMQEYGIDRPDLRKDKNDPNLLAFCWVKDFPFFEKEEDGSWTFTHNPFSRPIAEHEEMLSKKENVGDIITTQYDVVLNGFEIGGGSIRNHRPESLQSVFEILGMRDDFIQENFGHMMDAFKYGTPPHGGIAWGLDRIIAILQNEPNIREIIAFPKTGDGRDLMMHAPSSVSKQQLDELHLSIKK